MKVVSLKKLKSEIDSAIKTLELSESKVLERKMLSIEGGNSQGVLARCHDWLSTNENAQPTIRILSHLACSGGTLISKCIGAQPNVYLLSETHPHTLLNMYEGKAVYSPTDIVKLARYANVPGIEKLEEKIFIKSVNELYTHLESMGGDLVIREHLHADYCVGEKKTNSAVIKLLNDDYKVIRLVTTRHPLDTFLSLENNGWLHFNPPTINEFCKRYWLFIKEHSTSDVIRYEDFVSKPSEYMQLISDKLEISFDDAFMDTFPLIQVTGDSGRSGDVIQPRARRKVAESMLLEARDSKYYIKICNKLGYDI